MEAQHSIPPLSVHDVKAKLYLYLYWIFQELYRRSQILIWKSGLAVG